MSRPIWKGFITFGLVNIPVTLYSAEKKFDIQLKFIDCRDKSKIRYLRINEQTGEEVPWDEICKGYEYDKNEFILLNKEDLQAAAGKNAKSIDIVNFIAEKSLVPMEFEKPYYLVPEKKGQKAYVLLREALKNTKKIGIAKVVIHTRAYLAALITYKNALVLNLLRYHSELKQLSEFEFPEEAAKKYKITEKEMTIAKQLINSMSSTWKPSSYHDEYREELEKYVEAKLHHRIKKTPKVKAAAQPSNVINFVDLLKKSLEKEKKGKVSKPTKRAK